MHLELPNVRLHSLKDFAKHYLMIVLSILTALGLEAWIERSHHAHAAETAGRQIRAEIETNLSDVRTSIKANQALIAPLRALGEVVSQDIREGVPAAVINQHIQARKADFKLSINWPTFASQAWDVAVANQSASWMDGAELRHYSAAYADLRDASNWITHDSIILLNAPSMAALHTRIELGAPVDPLEFVTVLHQMVNTSEETQSHLRQLESHLVHALAKEDGGAAHG
ncbi:hypothetical protein RKE25_04150 [Dyella sp. BiH032]|uniref:hypothetical protein n=1 Tax=Dyella sp. BiH032 TaxID=3075430 RepID=UPI002892B0F9|nr:hypothetical protein [Dyella sp. BiH032]WNL46843.1 hypothetical protein RKE25_04150 [Dyella sp. BiH032]